VIRLVAVTVRLADVTAVDAASLELRAGEMLVVEGGRGAGKSVLLDVAAARRRPDEGRVWIAERDVSSLQRGSLPFVRRNVGYVGAEAEFLPGLTVLESVMLPLAARVESRERAREAAMRALGKVGVLGLAAHRPAVLSASARRLVAVARALVGAPPLLVLDDIVAGMSAADSGAVLSAVLGAVEAGAAAICASADGSFGAAAVKTGARRVRMDAGRLVVGAGPLSVVTGGRAARTPLREVAP